MGPGWHTHMKLRHVGDWGGVEMLPHPVRLTVSSVLVIPRSLLLALEDMTSPEWLGPPDLAGSDSTLPENLFSLLLILSWHLAWLVGVFYAAAMFPWSSLRWLLPPNHHLVLLYSWKQAPVHGGLLALTVLSHVHTQERKFLCSTNCEFFIFENYWGTFFPPSLHI